MWAFDASNVFAVGDNGVILRRSDGAGWDAMSSGTTRNLRSVWGSSPSDVWAGGASGTVLHFDGTSWTSVSTQASQVDSIWGSSSSNVWLTSSTSVLRWNGVSFTTFTLGATLLSVSGTGPNDVWVTGEQTQLRRYDGTSWTIQNAGIGNSMKVVLALATNDVWAAGVIAGKETAHYNGVKWVPIRTSALASNNAMFTSMSAEAADDVWAIGNSKVGHWNGIAWSLEELSAGQTLRSISTAPGHVWIVGDGGLILHRVR